MCVESEEERERERDEEREREEEEDGHARSMSEWRKEVPQMRTLLGHEIVHLGASKTRTSPAHCLGLGTEVTLSFEFVFVWLASEQDEKMHVLAGEKPVNLAQAGFLSEAQSRLGETLSPEREFDEILVEVTVGPSPRREEVA
ncbi:hypothetical protein DEO72_LG6g157 [Vigna unguiculata]|uniref:Uncharacterized protein n=1 Tax=Vigna unguiculata TaxID=3917 RepID=A0A4D6M644_VIGUN|nr:hypothetical protein DEO72_LG6g157 [Vigna unguiculata]